jgi:hypothetical protein
MTQGTTTESAIGELTMQSSGRYITYKAKRKLYDCIVLKSTF